MTMVPTNPSSPPVQLSSVMPPQTGRVRRRWPIVLGCLVALAAVPAGFYFYQAWASDCELRAAIEEAERLDPRWRFADILADRPPIPDEENAALVVLKVDALLRPGGTYLGEKNEALFEGVSSIHQLTAAQIAALRELMAKHPAALELARTIKDMPGGGRFPISHQPDFISTTFDPLPGAREVMRFLEYDVMLRAQDGDMAGAIESCRGLLCTARAIGEEPYIIPAAVRFAGQARTVEMLERVLAQGECPAEQLQAMQELLAREIEAPILAEAIRGERGSSDGIIMGLQSRDIRVSALTGGPGSGASWEGWMLEVLPGMVTRGRAEHLRLMNQAVEAARLPADQQGEAFARVDKARTEPGTSVVVRLLMPSVAKVALHHRRNQANMRCALVALVAERYRLKHGQFPPSLAALVQDGLLAAVPADPFDGQPLRYRVLRDGIVIYSVGVDLADNGGDLNRQNPTARGSDLGLLLWNENMRR